jgi:hypothetical protein
MLSTAADLICAARACLGHDDAAGRYLQSI